jgi:hypothetical protein
VNVFSSTGAGGSGLGCLSGSNVTVQAASVGSLWAVGGSESAGLGSPANASCGSGEF